MIKDKEELLQRLDHLLHNYMFHTCAVSDYSRRNFQDIKQEEYRFNFEDGTVGTLNATLFEDFFKDEEALKHSVQSFGMSYKNFTIAESYEFIKAYCNKSTKSNRRKFQEDTIHQYTDTIRYVRVLRNNCSHFSGSNEISWKDYSFKEAVWKNRTIKEGMKGDDIKINLIETISLLTDLISFVEAELE